MGETTADIDEETEHNDDKYYFAADKIGTSFEESKKQSEKANLTERLNKTDRVMKGLENCSKHKKMINKKNKTQRNKFQLKLQRWALRARMPRARF